jgi:hypothetical protein
MRRRYGHFACESHRRAAAAMIQEVRRRNRTGAVLNGRRRVHPDLDERPRRTHPGSAGSPETGFPQERRCHNENSAGRTMELRLCC